MAGPQLGMIWQNAAAAKRAAFVVAAAEVRTTLLHAGVHRLCSTEMHTYQYTAGNDPGVMSTVI